MATISINLDDNASDGLQKLSRNLSEVGAASDDLTESSSRLSDEQRQQITIIQRQQTDWKTLAARWAETNAQIKVTAIQTARDVSEAFIKSSEVVSLSLIRNTVGQTVAFAEIAADFGKFTVGAIAAATTASAIWGKPKTVIQQNTYAVREHTEAVEEGIPAVVKYGAAFLAATGGTVGLSAALALQRKHLTSIQDVFSSTGSTAFKILTGLGAEVSVATVAFTAWEAVMARTGIRVDELGNKSSNLDRIRAAAKGLGSDLSEPLLIAVDNAKQFVNNLNPIPAIWKEIDASATRSADQMIININILRDFVKGTRELEEANARLEAQREREAPGFEAIRRVNQTLAAQELARARQAEIASITTVQGINSEIQAVREKAARMAQAGEDAAKIEQTLLSEINALERQRTDIHDREETRRKEIAKAGADFRAELARFEARQRQEAIDRISDATDKELERLRELRKQKAEQEQRADQDSERARQLMRDQALAADVARKEKEVQAAQRAGEQQVQLEREKQERLKAIRAQAAEKAGINGQDLLNQADPRKVRQLLVDQAGQQARQQAAGANQDLFRQAQFDGDGAARRKYERLLEQAQKQAELQAKQQFARGQTDPQQLAQAQAQVAGQQLQALNGAGKISDSTLQATTELLQATAKTVATQDAQQRQIDQLARDAAALNAQAGAAQQRKRAQVGSQ